MANDPDRDRALASFRQAQMLKEHADERERRRVRLPIPPRLAAGMVALAIVGGFAAIFAAVIVPLFQATDPVKTFCQDIDAQNYASAYSYLAASLTQRISETQFEQMIQQDQFTGCSTSTGVTIAPDGKTAQIGVTFVFGSQNVRIEHGSISLVNESGGWRIASFQDATLTIP
jgi:hypothetical protein